MRVDSELGALPLGGEPTVDVVVPLAGEPLRLRGAFSRPLPRDLSFTIRVHTPAGIPVAVGQVTVVRGAMTFESTGLRFMGMEGYAHLSLEQSARVEARVWTRRAFATAGPAATGRVAC